jgi:integrase
VAARFNRLTTRRVETEKKPGRHADGGNLYLNVSVSGSTEQISYARSWVFMYRFGGKQREMGLGSVGAVPLARAREFAAQYRLALAEGRDPLTIRAAPKALTFGEAANDYIEAMSPAWKNAKHKAQWEMTLRAYAAPIRGVPVDQIGTEDVLRVLQPIWNIKAETASRVRGRIEAVLDRATAKKLRSGDNPARWRGHLDQVLPKRKRLSRGHHPALPIDDTPAFMVALLQMEGMAARALEFTILTAARTSETVGARWPEIDLPKRLWTRRPSRMKGDREHRIPLSDRAVAILEEMAAVRQSQFVFPSPVGSGRRLSNMTLLATVHRMNGENGNRWVDPTFDPPRPIVPHGFRSTFRDWASERTGFAHEVCEMALAHVIPNASEAAYRRGDLLEKRRELMAAWANYCAGDHANVIPIRAAG